MPQLPRLPRLPRPARRAVLVAHVTVSVGWLGISLCLLTLAIAAADDPDALAVPASTAMKLFADWLLLPVALLSLTTGLVLSLGTSWGLARHRWVWVKFWLTLAATGLTVFSFRPGAGEAAAMAAAGETVPATDLLVPPAVSLALYAFLTAVSVLKPWGPTRRGRRLREARTGRTAAAATEGRAGRTGAGDRDGGRGTDDRAGTGTETETGTGAETGTGTGGRRRHPVSRASGNPVAGSQSRQPV
ncbi:hypothetical protein [Streptomyces abyssalis]|uniref:hypothetical protein n=1 Tax=Streptomyces abyssalis TaxID=933944 RepID=UPI00085C6BD0